MAEDTKDCSNVQEESNRKTCILEIADTKETVKLKTDCQDIKDKNNPESTNTHGLMDDSNLHYEGDLCIYTDPVSKLEYIWSSDKNEWVLRPDKTNDAVGENISEKNGTKTKDGIFDKSAKESSEYDFDGESFCYTDKNTGKETGNCKGKKLTNFV